MPSKVPANLFGGVASGKTVKPESSNTVLPQNSNTAKPEKTTFYLEAEHADKLDDLRREYKRRTGRKINQQDIVRRLIEVSKVEDLL